MNNIKNDHGVFCIPHKVFDRKVGLNCNEKILFIALLALENRFLIQDRSYYLRKWFNIGNKDLSRMINLSEGKMMSARHRLLQKKIIDFRQGFMGRNSQYRILNGVLNYVGKKETKRFNTIACD